MKQEPHERTIYTPSQVNAHAKEVLERFSFWIQGEVSEFKRKETWYYAFLTLKDERAQIKCVVYPSLLDRLPFDMEVGKEILVFGPLSLYETRGEFQIRVRDIEEVGAGSLQKQLEELKNKLQKEGLFAEEAKQSLPVFPSRIGVITSSSGAAWHDVKRVVQQRFPGVELVLADTFVEGDAAPRTITDAIEAMNQREDIDVVIVTRGGGSQESLMAFNTEAVARAIFSSRIPVICAVGHEKDVSIAELCADRRAATPSNAAEVAVRDRQELLQRLDEINARISRVIQAFAELPARIDELAAAIRRRYMGILEHKTEQCNILARRITRELERFSGLPEDLSVLMERIGRRYRAYVSYRERDLRACMQRVKSVSPQATLARGYSVAYTYPERSALRDAADVTPGDTLLVRLARGKIYARVAEEQSNTSEFEDE